MRSQNQHSNKRKPPSREVFSTAAIVCEGEQTEPNYLKGLIQYLGINPNKHNYTSTHRNIKKNGSRKSTLESSH